MLKQSLLFFAFFTIIDVSNSAVKTQTNDAVRYSAFLATMNSAWYGETGEQERNEEDELLDVPEEELPLAKREAVDRAQRRLAGEGDQLLKNMECEMGEGLKKKYGEEIAEAIVKHCERYRALLAANYEKQGDGGNNPSPVELMQQFLDDLTKAYEQHYGEKFVPTKQSSAVLKTFRFIKCSLRVMFGRMPAPGSEQDQRAQQKAMLQLLLSKLHAVLAERRKEYEQLLDQGGLSRFTPFVRQAAWVFKDATLPIMAAMFFSCAPTGLMHCLVIGLLAGFVLHFIAIGMAAFTMSWLHNCF